MKAQLVDQEFRDAIATAFDVTFMVEAGAGTGKTEQLVSRMVGLVASGSAPIEQIAAITFTVAAASELRSRVRSKLEEVLGLRDSKRDAAVIADELGEDESVVRERCEAALRSIDRASISTIHAFAQTILAAFPLQAGLPPRFRVAESLEAAEAFDERWVDFLDSFLESPRLRDLARFTLLLGLRLNNIRELAESFHANWDRVVVDAFPAVQVKHPDCTGVMRALEAAVEFARDRQLDGDKLYEHVIELDEWAADLGAASGDRQLDLLLGAPKCRAGNMGSQGAWGGKAEKSAMLDLLEGADEAIRQSLAPTREAVRIGICRLVAEFTLEGAEARRLDGVLEFHDLLVFARNLLRADEWVRRRVREQFKFVLVDEFQDTDPVQIELCALIAAPDGKIDPKKRWYELDAEPGRIFFVGDPKQSIYRFRRADVLLYALAREKFGSGGRGGPPQQLYLTSNFRSTTQVIDWVNEVFSQVIGVDPVDGQPAYVPLAPTDAVGGEPVHGSVSILGDKFDSSGLKVGEVRSAEFRAVVSAISAIRSQGWKVGVRELGPDGRPPRLRDVAVLIRDRNSLPALDDAFKEAGIPYRLESRALVFASQEVRDLLSVLRAIVDPTDDVAVVAALKSVAFGCSDSDLLRYAVAAGTRGDAWRLDRSRPESVPPGDPVGSAMDVLRGYREEAWWLGPSGMLEHLVADRRILEKLSWSTQRRDAWRRVRFFVDQCRLFVQGGAGGLAEFVDWAERQAESSAGSGDALLSDPDEDSVRVTTIHGAKGLQYPIVIVAGIDSTERRGAPVIWVDEGEHSRAEVHLGTKESLIESAEYGGARQLEIEMARLETARLLYVATTRAEDHLLVSVFRAMPKNAPQGSPTSGATMIATALDACTAEYSSFDESSAAFGAERDGETEIGADAWIVPEDRRDEVGGLTIAADRWLAERRASFAEARRTPYIAATALKGRIDEIRSGSPASGPRTDVERDLPPWQLEAPLPDGDLAPAAPELRRGRAGTAIGRAVHGVLQVIDLETGGELEALSQDQAEAEGIPGLADEVAKRVRSALESEAVREAVAGGMFWREVFVASLLSSDAGLEGYVDLLYRRDGELVVVDYKTDSVASESDVDALMERYRYQGAAYAVAVARATGETVSAVRFVFATQSTPVERIVDNLGELIEEVVSTLVS